MSETVNKTGGKIMKKDVITHILCYDEFRGFAGELKKRFSDPGKYLFTTFGTKTELMESVGTEKRARIFRVAVIGIHDSSDQFGLTEKLTRGIKQSDPDTGLILIVPQEKTLEIQKAIRFNIDAYVPRNSNAPLRVHNAVKKLVSEYNLRIFRKKRNRAFLILALFLILSAVILLIARLRLPEYF